MAARLSSGADDRLAVADRLLRDPDLVERAVWPRACTWLIRLAVEHAIDDHWARTRPEMSAPNRRAQLIVLRHTRPDVGSAAAELWARLSLIFNLPVPCSKRLCWCCGVSLGQGAATA